jgi:hypothetical protein
MTLYLRAAARVAAFAAVIVAGLALIGCGGDDGDPGATPAIGSLLPTSTSTAEADPADLTPPYSLRTRDVPVAVTLPAGTTGPVWLRVFGLADWDIVRSVELTEGPDDLWTATVPLEDGALVHYAYDRGDLDDFDSLAARREAPATALDTTWRVVLVDDDLTALRDTVAMWTDARFSPATGSIEGIVTDSERGEPVVDAEVAIAGIHTATDYDGRFRLDGIPAGEQRLTVYRLNGDHRPAGRPVTIAPSTPAELALALDPARPMTVTLKAVLPADTPPDATIKVAGTAWQAGGGYLGAPGQADALRLPVAQRVLTEEGEYALLRLELYEGQSLFYRYTLAAPGLAQEVRLDADEPPRSLIAARSSRTRLEYIDAWRYDGQVTLTVRAEVPDNTPAGVPVQFVMGPGHWMSPTEDGAWLTTIVANPGDRLTYALRLGDSVEAGADASADAPEGLRTLVIPDADATATVTVTGWVGRPGVPAIAQGESGAVTFRVTIPAGTVDGHPLRIVGSGALGDGVDLTPVPGHPTLYQGAATLPEGRYTYEIWRVGPPEDLPAALSRQLHVAYTEQTVNTWVGGWVGEVPNTQPRDLRFVGGYYLPDLWSSGFAATTPSTLADVATLDGFAVLSSVWSYGQIRPTPVLEPRAVYAGSVATPLEALRDQAADARRAGVPIMLAPQFNMELSPGGLSALSGPKDQAWLDAWLLEAERLWLWNADLADDLGADLLLLPGPTFHVFDQPGLFPSNDSFEAFDAAVAALVARVRERYDGRVVISGGVRSMTAPAQADLIGVTTFDTGHPALAPSTTVAQWTAAYDALFEARLDPIHDTWEQPVFFYSLHVPSQPSPGDPTGEEAQARQLEGLLQALSTRTWVVAIAAWSYDMIEAPALPSDGFRGRLAEAVLAKHYALFNPADIAAYTAS